MIDDIGASAAGSIAGSLSGALGGGASGSLAASISAAASLAASAGQSGAASAAASVASGVSAAVGALAGGGVSVQASLGAGANGKGTGVRPPDPWLVTRFLVIIEGLGPISFQKLSGLKATMQSPTPTPAPHPAPQSPPPAGGANTPSPRSTTPPPVPHSTPSNGGQNGGGTQLPGTQWTWGDIVLSRGMAINGIALWTWLLDAVKGHPNPKSVTIQLFDSQNLPAMTWYIKKAYPSSWTFPTLDATAGPGTAVAIEQLNLKILNPQDVTVTPG
jgi:phage tail-like protein